MKKFKITGTDLFFAFQIVMAWFFALPQISRMFESVEGVTINWLLCGQIFMILNLYLAYRVYQKNKRKETLQTFLIYLNWVILITPVVIITFLKCHWTNEDTLIFTMVMILAALVVTIGIIQGKGISDPTVKGLLIGLFRIVPHLYLSYCIIQAGSSEGIAATSVWVANVTANARIITLILTGRKIKWEKSIIASLLSEVGCEISWVIVTIVWVIY